MIATHPSCGEVVAKFGICTHLQQWKGAYDCEPIMVVGQIDRLENIFMAKFQAIRLWNIVFRMIVQNHIRDN